MFCGEFDDVCSFRRSAVSTPLPKVPGVVAKLREKEVKEMEKEKKERVAKERDKQRPLI